MATHQIYIRDPVGNLLTVIQDFNRLEYARGAGNPGKMYLDLKAR